MYPPIFATVAADPGAQSIFGANPFRVFPFGEAPEGGAKPYAVWQTITGAPENYISNAPDIDFFLVQVDVYAGTASEARAAAKALRDALEPHAHIASWRGESRDSLTRLFRYSFDVSFWANR